MIENHFVWLHATLLHQKIQKKSFAIPHFIEFYSLNVFFGDTHNKQTKESTSSSPKGIH